MYPVKCLYSARRTQPCDHNGMSLHGHSTWLAMSGLWTRPFLIGTLRRYTHHTTPPGIYEAHVNMPSGSGARYPETVIVKLALSEDQKERIRHEYAIYRHLLYGPVPVAAGDVPTAFGFFQGIESDAGALILSYNSQLLAHRSALRLWNHRLSRRKVRSDDIARSRLKHASQGYVSTNIREYPSLVWTFERGTWSLMEKETSPSLTSMGQNSGA